jgi:hypothetical protein
MLPRTMKVRAVLTLISLLPSGCSSAQAHYNLVTLKDQAEFESNCSKDRIEVVTARDVNPDQTSITLLVCGKRQQWQRFGLNYFPEGQGLPGARSH